MKKVEYLILFVFIVICFIPLTTFAGEIDLPPSGTDISTLRCADGIISIGDSARDVLTRCGDPLTTGWMAGKTYDISVYHLEGSAFIHYLGFRNKRLQRIYSVNCIKDDPLCQE